MPNEPEDLGDSRSRLENARFREMDNRNKANAPEYAYMPRYVPQGNWHASGFDIAMAVLGALILIAVVVVNVFF